MPPRPISRSPRPARGAPSSWAPARSARPSRCCWRAAASAPRCRRARPSSAPGSRPTARTATTCRRRSCRASCGSSRRRPGLARADFVFLGVPSGGLAEVIAGLSARGLDRRTPVISLAKGLVPPRRDRADGAARAGARLGRVACVGGPAHAREMVTEGAGLVAASLDERLAGTIANVFMRAGVVCEQSSDPIGVELAGVAKNAAALAAGATEASASTRPAPPPGTSSRRSGATPSARARARSR